MRSTLLYRASFFALFAAAPMRLCAAASISASPNPCIGATLSASLCTSTISWDAGVGVLGQVTVVNGGGSESLFACGTSGSQDATWIPVNGSYTFKLYSATDCSQANETGVLATVTVSGQSPAPLPTVTNFSANPNPVVAGQSTTLNWNTQNANSVTIAGLGSFGPNGSTTVSPNVNTTYTMTAFGTSGNTTASVAVVVTSSSTACSSSPACGNGFYCDPSATCQALPAITPAISAPANGAAFTLGQNVSVQGSVTGSNPAFISNKVGLVITVDGLSVCQGQGYQCSTSFAPALGTHTMQAIAYVSDVNGYYAAATSTPLSITVSPATPSCSATSQCGAGTYCDPSATCQPLPAMTPSITQPTVGAAFTQGQPVSLQATVNSSNMPFVSSKVGLVVNMDGAPVCRGQGYQCNTTLTPAVGTHTLQAIAYVVDVQGYYAAAYGTSFSYTVSAATSTPIPCSSTPQCGGGFYCAPSASCQVLPSLSVAMTQPANGLTFTPGQSISVSGTAASSDSTFLGSKVGLVITMDGAAVCQGQGYQCTSSATPSGSAHTLVGIAYVQDVQGYYAAAQSAPVTIVPNTPVVNVTLNTTSVSLNRGQAQQFNATVTGTNDPSVTWSMNPPLGTLLSSGLYRAPGGLTSPQTVTITATSNADPSASAQAVIHLSNYTPLNLSTPATRDDMLGITDWGGTYRLTSQGTQLEEEAQEIEEMGTDSIYVALSYNYQTDYLNSNFGSGITSLATLAQSAPFSNVFHGPFHTYVMATFSFSNTNYMTQPNLAGEYQEIYDLATTLLRTYAGSGKTFVVQNWELDNAMAIQENCDTAGGCATSDLIKNFTPHPSDVQNVIDWFNVRQQAIIDARRDAGTNGVQVLQAAQFNLVSRARTNLVSALSSVLPHIDTDLMSYSSYETINVDRNSMQNQIASDISFINSLPGAHNRQLIIGEFGWPTADADVRTNLATQSFFNSGVVRAMYWALYDNGSGQSLITSGGDTTPAGNIVDGITDKEPIKIGPPGGGADAFTLSTSGTLHVTTSGTTSHFNWTLTGQGATSASLHYAAGMSAWGLAYSDSELMRVQTTDAQLDFSALHLGVGTYHVLVYAVDAKGRASEPINFDVVLVNPTSTDTNESAVRVYPNPWKATMALQKAVTFDGLSGHSTIKIFTVSGHSVQTLGTDNESTNWNLCNRSGEDVASGIYLYLITNDQGMKVHGKFVLIR